ncbi:MAG TPA: hypothetical protein VJV23_03985 [Candidatus Polarisedimenticolia bacterium]|nr:hypothetical protein [Candidatus Polarisedimenticolia bacterium]
MNRQEAIAWLQAILDDTLDPNDDADAGRRKAVAHAIREMTRREATGPRPARCPKVGESTVQVSLREKLEKRGERSLSNTDLLSLILEGGKGKNLHHLGRHAHGPDPHREGLQAGARQG